MGYIEKNLIKDESVVYRAKLHWIIFIWPVIWFLLALISFAYSSDTSAAAFSIFFILAIVSGISVLITFLTSEFGVTNKRIIAKTGFIRRNSIEILLKKVEGIKVNQGILGRIFNYGTITVSGTGGAQDPFKKISCPLTLRNQVQSCLME